MSSISKYCLWFQIFRKSVLYKNQVDLLLLQSASLSLGTEVFGFFVGQIQLVKQYPFFPEVQEICWTSKAEVGTDPSCLMDKVLLQFFDPIHSLRSQPVLHPHCYFYPQAERSKVKDKVTPRIFVGKLPFAYQEITKRALGWATRCDMQRKEVIFFLTTVTWIKISKNWPCCVTKLQMAIAKQPNYDSVLSDCQCSSGK